MQYSTADRPPSFLNPQTRGEANTFCRLSICPDLGQNMETAAIAGQGESYRLFAPQDLFPTQEAEMELISSRPSSLVEATDESFR